MRVRWRLQWSVLTNMPYQPSTRRPTRARTGFRPVAALLSIVGPSKIRALPDLTGGTAGFCLSCWAACACDTNASHKHSVPIWFGRCGPRGRTAGFGIEVSDDPLLAARSSACAKSFDLRTAAIADYPRIPALPLQRSRGRYADGPNGRSSIVSGSHGLPRTGGGSASKTSQASGPRSERISHCAATDVALVKAAMVLAILFIGIRMVSTLQPKFQTLIAIHRPLGIAILQLAIVRLGVRLCSGTPSLPSVDRSICRRLCRMATSFTPSAQSPHDSCISVLRDHPSPCWGRALSRADSPGRRVPEHDVAIVEGIEFGLSIGIGSFAGLFKTAAATAGAGLARL
jgi:hypothetical protein